MLAVFSHPGRPYGELKTRRLTEIEYVVAHSYVLLNEAKVEPYVKMYEELLEELHPDMNEQDIASQMDNNFATWFENYLREKTIENKYIRDLSRRPLHMVKSYNVYFVNGYKFHNESYGENKVTKNSGVCISSDSCVTPVKFPFVKVKQL
ncbi:hypothetical protein LXL04_028174 [Taraxacum kok-saghyz]